MRSWKQQGLDKCGSKERAEAKKLPRLKASETEKDGCVAHCNKEIRETEVLRSLRIH